MEHLSSSIGSCTNLLSWVSLEHNSECPLNKIKYVFFNNLSFLKWAIVCLDKRKGGLGVRCLSTLNRALLCKWNWRFATEGETIWKQVISRKFGEEEGGWRTREVREGFGVGFWKEIKKEGSLLQNKLYSLWGMVEEWDFRRTNGAGTMLFLVISPLCMP